MNGTRRLGRGAAVALLVLASGCAGRTAPEPPKVDPALAENVLDAVPSDIQRTFIDFEGKVHLVGYKLEPARVATLGSQVKVTLFWQPVQKLEFGWRLFTHIVDDNQRQIANLDDVGPLRKLEGDGAAQHQVLGPSQWQPGKIYVDEQTFEVPKDTRSTGITIMVGIWRPEAGVVEVDVDGSTKPQVVTGGGTRLPIVSGTSDGHNSAVVAHLSTGLAPAPPVVQKPKT